MADLIMHDKVTIAAIAWRLCIVMAVLTAATGGIASAQDEPGTGAPPVQAGPPPPDELSESPESLPAANQSGAAAAAAVQRVHVLREGSYLIDARGTLETRADGLLWLFSPSAAGGQPVQRTELVLLPCSLLAEMQRLVRALPGSPGERVVIELTGQVMVYKGRNFLLPTSAARLVGFQPQQGEPTSRDDGAGGDVAGGQKPGEGGDGAARSADEAEQQLQRALSGLGQAAPRGIDESSEAAASDQAAREASSRALQSQSEGTILASRRGTIVRDAGGAWVFAFDADAEGAADPPLVLLPCLQLERIEEYARLMGAHAPVLLSGRISRYEDRGYILPTAFRIPAEHSRVTP